MERSGLWQKLRGTLIVLLLLAFAIIIVLLRSSIAFTNIQRVEYVGDRLFGVNVNRTQNQIFRVSTLTGEGDFLRVNQLKNNEVRTFPDFIVTDEGEMFLAEHVYRPDAPDTLRLVRWNTGKRRLDKICEFAPESGLELIDLNYREGIFYLLFNEKAGEDAGKRSIYAIDLQGDISRPDSAPGVVWDRNMEFVSVSSLPVKGVRLPAGRVLCRILAISAAVLAISGICAALLYSARARGRRAGLIQRLCTLTIIVITIMIAAFNFYLRIFLYGYLAASEFFNCTAAVEISRRMIDEKLLESMIAGEAEINRESCELAWGFSGDYRTAVGYEENGSLVLLGDLYESGVYRMEIRGGHLREAMDSALTTGQMEGVFYSGQREEYVAAVGVVELASGRRAAVAAQIPVRELLIRFSRLRRVIMRICAVIGTALFIAMLLVILNLLSPLESLKRAVTRFTAGDLDARAGIRGHGELTVTAQGFNNLAEQISHQTAGADSYRRFYEAFLPVKLWKDFTGNHHNLNLVPGACCSARAATLSITPPADVRSDRTGEQEYLTFVLDRIRKCGGVCTAMAGKRQIAVFAGDPADALRTGVLISHEADEGPGIRVSMGAARSRVYVNVVGNESRRNLFVENSREAQVLSDIAGMLGAGMVVTEDICAEMKRQDGGFHFRPLGRMSLGPYVSDAPLYEVLDVLTAEQRKSREFTAAAFARGIRAYEEGRYFEARTEMIRVMEADPEDRAARCYIMNCDRKEPPVICQAER